MEETGDKRPMESGHLEGHWVWGGVAEKWDLGPVKPEPPF